MRSEGLMRALYLDVINPNHITALQSNGVATPHVLRVKLSDVNVLQDDVCSTHNAEAFTLDDTR
jgi:hypothetical protein